MARVDEKFSQKKKAKKKIINPNRDHRNQRNQKRSFDEAAA